MCNNLTFYFRCASFNQVGKKSLFTKRIPVTSEMIRSFQKSSLRQLSILHSLDLPQSFYSTTVLTVGGSTKLAYKETHVEGDLSGILKKHTSFIASPFTKPGARISGVKDWNKKLDLMVEKAPKPGRKSFLCVVCCTCLPNLSSTAGSLSVKRVLQSRRTSP